MYSREPLVLLPLPAGARGGEEGVEGFSVGNEEAKCRLGESPLWSNSRGALFWVDILGKKLFCLRYEEKVLERWDLESMCPHLGRPCCLALCKSSRILIAFEEHFAFFDPDSHDLKVADIITASGEEWSQIRLKREGFNVRLNDGRVDPNGNLVIGGINESWGDFRDGWKAVQPCYRVTMNPVANDPHNLTVSVVQHIPLVKITNSICFSRDGSMMYHTDTPTKDICVFFGPDYVEKKVVITTEYQPDGSIIDARNGLWNAEYEGGVVRRYDLSAVSESAIDIPINADTSIYLPVKQTTCPCIGGPEGDILFVTTASNFFRDTRYTEEPLAGQVFLYKLPSSLFFTPENLFNDML